MSRVFKVGVSGISGSTVGASISKTGGCLGGSTGGACGRKTGNCLGGLARSAQNIERLTVAGRCTAGCV